MSGILTEEKAVVNYLVKYSLVAVTEMTHTSDNFISVKLEAKGRGRGSSKVVQSYLCSLLIVQNVQEAT